MVDGLTLVNGLLVVQLVEEARKPGLEHAPIPNPLMVVRSALDLEQRSGLATCLTVGVSEIQQRFQKAILKYLWSCLVPQ